MSREGELELDLFAPMEVEEARARPEAPPVWSVSALNRAAKRCLEGRFPEVWVSGEVANWTRARSGHRYFTLKDDEAQLRAVMVGPGCGPASHGSSRGDEGPRLRIPHDIRGERRVSDLGPAPRGEGEEGLWRLAFERTRAALEADGLLDPRRKRGMPRFPPPLGW